MENLFLGNISEDGNLFNRIGHVGYIALAGRPNVGKSTLINEILGYHLSAVSSRPQTTRKQWKGFFTDWNSQLIFTDTPGIHEPTDKLGKSMSQVIIKHINDADIVICLADASRDHLLEDEMVAETLRKFAKKIVLVINKIDVANEKEISETEHFFKEKLGERIKNVVRISALKGNGVKDLLSELKKMLPKQPFLYDPDEITDAYERDIVCELIQEAVFENLRQEVPHGVAVKIDSWKEDAKKIAIKATVHTDREAHKRIIVGTEGSQLSQIKRDAIAKIRENIDKRVDLTLFVKVSNEWRNKKTMLEEFGFEV